MKLAAAVLSYGRDSLASRKCTFSCFVLITTCVLADGSISLGIILA